jgi:hypothetical protein
MTNDNLPPLPQPKHTFHFGRKGRYDTYTADQMRNYARAALEAQAARIAELERALRDIAEEWAGAECGEPVYAQEAYAIGLAKRMYALAADALKAKQ